MEGTGVQGGRIRRARGVRRRRWNPRVRQTPKEARNKGSTPGSDQTASPDMKGMEDIDVISNPSTMAANSNIFTPRPLVDPKLVAQAQREAVESLPHLVRPVLPGSKRVDLEVVLMALGKRKTRVGLLPASWVSVLRDVVSGERGDMVMDELMDELAAEVTAAPMSEAAQLARLEGRMRQAFADPAFNGVGVRRAAGARRVARQVCVVPRADGAGALAVAGGGVHGTGRGSQVVLSGPVGVGAHGDVGGAA